MPLASATPGWALPSNFHTHQEDRIDDKRFGYGDVAYDAKTGTVHMHTKFSNGWRLGCARFQAVFHFYQGDRDVLQSWLDLGA